MTFRTEMEDFARFFYNTNGLALAFAVILGNAGGDMIGSFIDNILMPIISKILMIDNWKDKQIVIFNIRLDPLHVLSKILYFILVILSIYVLVGIMLHKMLLRGQWSNSSS